MSYDPQHEKMVQHHGPVHSEPVVGHEGTSFESTDASVGIVLGSLGIIGVTLLITALLTFPIQNILKKANPPGKLPSPIAHDRVVPPAPYLQVRPWVVFPDLVAEQNKGLSEGGKDQAGNTRMPIDQAINGVASTLKVAPNAPSGLTTPGGNGRDYSQSLAAMPNRAQQGSVTIQGEIHKNAQPQATH